MRPSLLLLALLTACAPRAASPDAGAGRSTVAVAATIAGLDLPARATLPDSLSRALKPVFDDHSLALTPSDALVQGLETLPSPEARVARIDAREDTDLVLLIEAVPAYDSQMAGRYRWSVPVTATLQPSDRPELAQSWSWKVPVALQFSHEHEEAALAAASPVIARHVESVLEEFLAAQKAD